MKKLEAYRGFMENVQPDNAMQERLLQKMKQAEPTASKPNPPVQAPGRRYRRWWAPALACVLLAALLPVLWQKLAPVSNGSAMSSADMIAGTTGSAASEKESASYAQNNAAMGETLFQAVYVRTGGAYGVQGAPETTVVRSRAELEQYYKEYREFYQFDLAAQGDESFADAMQKYDDGYFTDRILVLAIIEEDSSALGYRVEEILPAQEGGLTVRVKRTKPEGTCYLAEWHVFLELKASDYGGGTVTLESDFS